MSDFFEKFPKLADTELRNITLLPGSSFQLPPDRYVFIELYCDEQGCDCRRVVIAVFAEKERRFVAYINIGFDTDNPMAGPFLDPINPQTDYAQRLLEIFTNLINHDTAYLRRLQRHYVMFKEKVEARRYKGPPFEKAGSVKRIAEPPEFAGTSTTTVSMPSVTPPSPPLSDPVVRQQPKVGRKAPCPCGSGKKYKKCCMLKPQTDRDEHSEPTDTPNNPSTAAVTEKESAQPPVAEQYLNTARSLVADLVKRHRQASVDKKSDSAHKIEMETMPEIAYSFLQLLLQSSAERGHDDDEPEEYSACLQLLEDALTEIRYSVDRQRPWAIKLAEQIQIEIAEQAFRSEVDVRLQSDLTFAIHQSKLSLHPRISERHAELAEYYNRFSYRKGTPDMDKLFVEMAREVGSSSPFDLLDPMLAEMDLMPVEGQLLMAAQMMTTSQTLFNELAVLLLLHPNSEVRNRLPVVFSEVGGDKHITPLGLRRLIGLRNWLPPEERPAVDKLIRRVRLANIASAPLPRAGAVTGYASSFDGSGTQGSWMSYRVKKDHHAVGVLVKQGKGIHDVWQQQGYTKTDIDAMAKDMRSSGGAERVPRAFFQRLIAHFIAVGIRNNAPPPAQLLIVDEELGGEYWKPQWVSPDQEIERMLAAEPRSFTPDKVDEALSSSRDWPERLSIASSWFEDDVRVDELLRQRAGPPSRWLSQIAVGSTLVLENILEGKREVWTERLLWMALWSQACLARKPLRWQDLLILTRELQRGTPLSDIPLMHAIATRSVQSAWQRAQVR